MENTTIVHEQVKEYYGHTLQTKDDLKSNCCTAAEPPAHYKPILSLIEDEIMTRFYGCGSPFPDALEGLTVLDLGCGTGRDCYLLSALVGQEGKVIGIDMTDEQLEVARKYQEVMAQKFGHDEPNTKFIKGYIENLKEVGIEDASIDLVVSNCVVNLASDKEAVMREVLRVLKPGGEVYFSDIYADRRIPEHLVENEIFYGECLGGALYREDFRRLMNKLGVPDIRTINQSIVTIENPQIQELAGNIKFHSELIRIFKLDNLEDLCEDFGQIAIYKGTISHAKHVFHLDDHHIFYTNQPMLVCGNTASMIQNTRFSKHFDILGDRSQHFGVFDCKDSSSPINESARGACC